MAKQDSSLRDFKSEEPKDKGMAVDKTSIINQLTTDGNDTDSDSIEIIDESIENSNQLKGSLLKMNSHNFWRPFESPLKSYTSRPDNTFNGQSTQFTFDLNHQNSQPIAYLSTSPERSVVKSTLRQHLCGNTLLNTQTRGHPYYSVPKESQVLNRFVPIQPKPENFENGINWTKERPEFKCEFTGCGKAFRFKSALVNHNLVHSDERKFCCTECGKRYKQLSGLYSHQTVKHSQKPKKRFVCETCGESFVDYRNLRIHEYNQHESDEFTKFFTRAPDNRRRGSEHSIAGHSSDDSNHSH